MKAKIFSFVKCSENSVIASVWITRFVAENLDLPYVCPDPHREIFNCSRDGVLTPEAFAAERLDVLVIVNGAFAFTGKVLLEALGAVIQNAGRVIWVQNDYTVIPPKDESDAMSPFRLAFRNRKSAGKPRTDFWSTVQVMSIAGGTAPTGHLLGDNSQYVNWNILAFRPGLVPKPWEQRVAADSLLYYGSWRVLATKNKRDRSKYFDRYFAVPAIPTVFSSPSNKPAEHYLHPLMRHGSKLENLHADIGEFGLGLYIEDQRSHEEFHSPANRLYEMLSAGLPVVFQPEAARMLSRAGFEIGEFMLWNAGDAPAMLEKKQEILEKQRELWLSKCEAELAALPGVVKTAWSKYL